MNKVIKEHVEINSNFALATKFKNHLDNAKSSAFYGPFIDAFHSKFWLFQAPNPCCLGKQCNTVSWTFPSKNSYLFAIILKRAQKIFADAIIVK